MLGRIVKSQPIKQMPKSPSFSGRIITRASSEPIAQKTENDNETSVSSSENEKNKNEIEENEESSSTIENNSQKQNQTKIKPNKKLQNDIFESKIYNFTKNQKITLIDSTNPSKFFISLNIDEQLYECEFKSFRDKK